MSKRNSLKKLFGFRSSELPDPTQQPYQQNPAPVRQEPPPDYDRKHSQYPPEDFSPPPGPPPTSFSPPSGPPPGYAATPAPFEPLDDDAELPPPPNFTELHPDSYTTNASEDLAKAGWDFCAANPLFGPRQFPPAALQRIATGHLMLAPPPPHFRGMIKQPGTPGTVHVSTAPGCPDTCLMSELPLFSAGYHHPGNTQRDRRLYYEITVESMPRDAAIAIGYAAIPYPSFRLPGWNRGSLGVHGDDGRRYENDSFGGRTFIEPFRPGDRMGIGMIYPTMASAGEKGIEIVITRNGRKEGGWMLNEVRDAEAEKNPLEGLDSSTDVYATIGVFGGGVNFGVQFFSDFDVPDIFHHS